MQGVVKSLFVMFVTLVIAGRTLAADEAIREDATTVKYVVRYPGAESLAYQVTLSFPGLADGKTAIGIPSSYASATGAEKGVQRLRALTPGVKLLATDDVSRVTVEHQPFERLTLAYDFVPIDASAPGAGSRTQFLPVMQTQYLHWMGPTSWVFPLIPSRGEASIKFEGLPATWKVASSFGHGPEFTFRWSPNTLLHSLVIAGDFRMLATRLPGGDRRVTLAVRGSWPVSDDELAASLTKMIEGQRQFWRDEQGKSDFLVTLLPLEANGPSTLVGTALLNSFTTFATPDNSFARIKRLWMHESLHQWLPRAFGGLANPQAKLYWFSEGFTEYLTFKLMWRWDLVNLQRFVDTLNEALHGLAVSKYAGLGNDELAAGFDRSQEIQLLAYRRGMLLAASWDNDIRATSKGQNSLDDALRWLLVEQGKSPQSRLTRNLIENMARQFRVSDPAADIDHYVEFAKPIRLRVSSLLPCVTISNAETRVVSNQMDDLHHTAPVNERWPEQQLKIHDDSCPNF